MGSKLHKLDTDELEDWWLRSRDRLGGADRRSFDSRVILTCWLLWKQRNARAFNNRGLMLSVVELVSKIREEGSLWHRAGVGGCRVILGE